MQPEETSSAIQQQGNSRVVLVLVCSPPPRSPRLYPDHPHARVQEPSKYNEARDWLKYALQRPPYALLNPEFFDADTLYKTPPWRLVLLVKARDWLELSLGCDSATGELCGRKLRAEMSEYGFSGILLYNEADRIRRLESNVVELQAELASTNARFDELQARFDDLQGRFNDLQCRFDEQTARFNVLQGNFNGLMTDHQELVRILRERQ